MESFVERMKNVFLLTSLFFAVKFVYHDISLLQLIFLLSDPNHQPRAGQRLPVAPDFVLYWAIC